LLVSLSEYAGPVDDQDGCYEEQEAGKEQPRCDVVRSVPVIRVVVIIVVRVIVDYEDRRIVIVSVGVIVASPIVVSVPRNGRSPIGLHRG
jgi:hypothetical protein